MPDSISTVAELARHLIDSTPIESLVVGDHQQTCEQLMTVARNVAGLHSDSQVPVAILFQLDADGWLLLLAAIASGRPIIPLDGTVDRRLLLTRLGSIDACGLLVAPGLEHVAEKLGLETLTHDSPDTGSTLIEVRAEDPAVICFTSGSTGKPKVYARTQGGLFILGRRRTEARNLEEGYRQMCCMSPMFVGFINNVAQMLYGAACCVPMPFSGVTPEELLETIRKHRVNFIPLVPTILRRLVHLTATTEFPECLRIINLSGELMTRSDFRGWLNDLPETTAIHVSYGSTESGTLTILPVKKEMVMGEGPVALGTPLPGVELEVVDDDLNPCPPGVQGLVHARSPHEVITVGSNTDPLPHVEIHGKGGDWFPMGDQGYFNEAGSLVVVGRSDGEVKVDGHRFDPGACESGARSLDGVRDAVTVMGKDGDRVIPFLFVVAAPDARSEIRAHLQASSSVGNRVRIEIRPELPQLTTGKVDRKALAKEAAECIALPVSSTLIKGRNPTECVIQDVWINHLKIMDPPLDRTFQELGGNSLAFLKVMLELRDRYGVALPQNRLQELNTIELQAKAATISTESDHMKTPLIEFSPGDGSGAAILILPGLGGHVWAFKPLAESLVTNASVAGLDWSKTRDFSDLTEHVRQWVGDRSLVIVGFSGGCSVAGELTARLEQQGCGPRRLIILDGVPRTSLRRRIKGLFISLDPRTKSAHDPLDQYLEISRKRGRAFQRHVRFAALGTPVRLLLSRTTSEEYLHRWQSITQTELFRSDSEHLDLVRYPIPSEVSKVIVEA
jgi:acyl-coenzyme A synthetase/AMP-(fatty) acid ligase/thioesterase domain-containing protein/acyl carrier protein